MLFEITYEFEVALIGRDEALNEEYHSTEKFTYEVENQLVKSTIVDLVMDDYRGFKDHKQSLFKFIDDHDLWYDLEDEYKEPLTEILYDLCYNRAFKEWCKEKQGD